MKITITIKNEQDGKSYDVLWIIGKKLQPH